MLTYMQSTHGPDGLSTIGWTQDLMVGPSSDQAGVRMSFRRAGAPRYSSRPPMSSRVPMSETTTIRPESTPVNGS